MAGLCLFVGFSVADGFYGQVVDRFDSPVSGALAMAVRTDTLGPDSMVCDYSDSLGNYEINAADGLVAGYWKLKGRKGGWVSQWYGPYYWNGTSSIQVNIKLDIRENVPD